MTDSNYSIADVQNNNDVSSFHDFVDDEESELCDSLSWYRRFHSQFDELSDTLNDRSDDNCQIDSRNLQCEMYWEINREHIQFDEFIGYEKAVQNL